MPKYTVYQCSGCDHESRDDKGWIHLPKVILEGYSEYVNYGKFAPANSFHSRDCAAAAIRDNRL
jgi:hypothetical protein